MPSALVVRTPSNAPGAPGSALAREVRNLDGRSESKHRQASRVLGLVDLPSCKARSEELLRVDAKLISLLQVVNHFKAANEEDDESCDHGHDNGELDHAVRLTPTSRTLPPVLRPERAPVNFIETLVLRRDDGRAAIGADSARRPAAAHAKIRQRSLAAPRRLFIVSDRLALVLQGGGAGPWTAPILIPSLAMEEVGATVEVVPYPAFRPEGLDLHSAREFDEHVSHALRTILESGTWSHITFIAKSRGTLYLAAMSERLPCERVDAIWVTPLLGLDYVRNGVLAKAWPSLIVAGGADPYHDLAAHEEVCSQLPASELVIDKADHGLVVAGDVRATVGGFQALAEASLAFASRM